MKRKRSRFSTTRREVIARRQRLARTVADQHDGVARRKDLRAAGLTDADIRAEVEAGRWTRLGRHTIGVTVSRTEGRARRWWAVWESGSGAVLDGEAALIEAGLKNWTLSHDQIRVSLPSGCTAHPLPGVRPGYPRRLGDVMTAGLPRTAPAVAAVRAAQEATSDRQSATILAMTVQQRLVRPQDLLAEWQRVQRSPRAAFLTAVIRDICDGAHSLGELDFAALCRDRGLPAPSRQTLREGPNGHYYLDVYWEDLDLHVEVDGCHHQLGMAMVSDAFRQNEIALNQDITLRIPVLGLRTQPEKFLDQVARGLEEAGARRVGSPG
ncbi:type IV toxin-antitoxin system AbiEi family antitoxin domain-containing protein [Ornithinimicrobium sp. F0845]|uniref:type IV toxin-antitoxin system AbiEi family antitoxin domain-containing protein n=1 Tax=Ornithinimicrobium sp. F0845 TaxID=2926412 RepID=UPI001FF39DD1|nr:type IV toxin-antitoxin system AbiEi family antitoxin domain-containing protein [Ornithinimicrobium sp. F0845]MCK0110713.1 type IV toxin-antitoxin system AbiEi family antitoxin domain-containing protein [Ornithinimicrobium sp. F0845]